MAGAHIHVSMITRRDRAGQIVTIHRLLGSTWQDAHDRAAGFARRMAAKADDIVEISTRTTNRLTGSTARHEAYLVR